MDLRTIQDDGLERVLDDTYPAWGEGLSRRAYGQWQTAQSRVPWARTNLRRVGFVDEAGTPVVTAKRYELTARLDGREIAVLGIGAVFTRSDQRGRGHARGLISALIDEARAKGAAAALLFSEIGAPYYEAMGFTAVPQPIARAQAIIVRGASGTLVRGGDERDFPAIAAITARYTALARFAPVRSEGHIQFFLTRRRLLAGLGPLALRDVEFFVAEEAHKAVAYVVATRSPTGWTLDDCGDLDPTGARLGAILEALAAREPSQAPPIFRAWLPPGFAAPQVRILGHDPAPAVMMIRSLTDAPIALASTEVVYPALDVF